MSLEMTTRCKRFPAHITGERFVPSVGANVICKMMFVCSFEFTQSTSMRSITGVKKHVSLQSTFGCQLFPTFCTYVRFLCMFLYDWWKHRYSGNVFMKVPIVLRIFFKDKILKKNRNNFPQQHITLPLSHVSQANGPKEDTQRKMKSFLRSISLFFHKITCVNKSRVV